MDVYLKKDVIADLVLQKTLVHKKLFEVLDDSSSRTFSVWLPAGSVDALQSLVYQEAGKLNIPENEALSRTHSFFSQAKFFSITGESTRQALQYSIDSLSGFSYDDIISIINFKRICPQGLIVSSFEHTGKNLNNAIALVNEIIDYEAQLVIQEQFLAPEQLLTHISKGEKPQMVSLLDLQREYREMVEEIDEAVLQVVSRTQYILGPQVGQLEKQVADYLGVEHCIGVSSGTDALVLSLRALALQNKGKEYFNSSDEIITTPFTFTATGDAILRAGATPVFVDINPVTFNLDPDKVAAAITPQTAGIIPVHLYGQACNMDELNQLALKHNLFILEDVAQAIGSSWGEKKAGSMGTLGAMSFFPSKNLGGFGDAGMVSTNDSELSTLVRMLLKHGGKDKYNVDHIGYNARLDTMQAAIVLVKLKYLDRFNALRKKIANFYLEQLQDISWMKLPRQDEKADHVYHQFTVRAPALRRDRLQQELNKKGISTMVYYPVPLHQMGVFTTRCERPFPLLQAEKACKEVLSLPIEPLSTRDELQFVANTLREISLENL